MKLLASTLALLLAFSTAFAGQKVGSANIMGYSKVTVHSNQMALVALNFETEANTVDDLFGDLPTGASVQFWNKTAQIYTSIQKGRSGWGAGGTNHIRIGEGVFLSLPANVERIVRFSGDVLAEGTTTVYSANGLTSLSFPYSCETSFTNTALAKTAMTGDAVSFWNNGWISYQRGRSGWSGVDDVKIKLGEGFFYNTSSGKSIDEVKPYLTD